MPGKTLLKVWNIGITEMRRRGRGRRGAELNLVSGVTQHSEAPRPPKSKEAE